MAAPSGDASQVVETPSPVVSEESGTPLASVARGVLPPAGQLADVSRENIAQAITRRLALASG